MSNTLLNFAVDQFSWQERKEIEPDFEKWIGVHMKLKADDYCECTVAICNKRHIL